MQQQLRLVRENENQEEGGIFSIKLNSSFKSLVGNHPKETLFIEFLTNGTGILTLGSHVLPFSLRAEDSKECYNQDDDHLNLVGSCDSRIIVQQTIDEEVSAQLKKQTENARADRNLPKAKTLPFQLPPKQKQSTSSTIKQLGHQTKSIPTTLSKNITSQSQRSTLKKPLQELPPVVPPSSQIFQHSWIVLQGVSSLVSARDVEHFLDGIILSPPLDTSPHDGMLAVCYLMGSGGEQFVDVYVKCHSCDGAQVALLRNNEPFVIANQPQSVRSITIRANVPLCEIYWASGVGIHLTNKKTCKSIIDAYSTDCSIPISLFVFDNSASIQSSCFTNHVHHKLFELLLQNTSSKSKQLQQQLLLQKRKRKRNDIEVNRDRLVEEMWLISGRQSCSMPEVQFGLQLQLDSLNNSNDPLENFLGTGVLTGQGIVDFCPTCRLLVENIEALLTLISNLWTNQMIGDSPSSSPMTAGERSGLDYLDRYWQTYAGLYQFILKEYHLKGRIASCACHIETS